MRANVDMSMRATGSVVWKFHTTVQKQDRNSQLLRNEINAVTSLIHKCCNTAFVCISINTPLGHQTAMDFQYRCKYSTSIIRRKWRSHRAFVEVVPPNPDGGPTDRPTDGDTDTASHRGPEPQAHRAA